MNNSINYGSFIDMLVSSDDEYEPYGLEMPAQVHGARHTEVEPVQVALYDRALGPIRDD